MSTLTVYIHGMVNEFYLDRWVLVQTLHNVRFFASVATDQKMQKKLITETVNMFFRYT